MEKIIFLDIDGVLNSQDLAYKNKEQGLSGYGGWFIEQDKCTHENVLWGTELVANLKSIVKNTGAKIVISSTWRLHFTIEKFKEMFSVYGWPDVPVIDFTDSIGFRGDEVQRYVQNNNIKNYVILDDCSDFRDYQKNHFVNTDFMEGLSTEDAEKAIEILNG